MPFGYVTSPRNNVTINYQHSLSSQHNVLFGTTIYFNITQYMNTIIIKLLTLLIILGQKQTLNQIQGTENFNWFSQRLVKFVMMYYVGIVLVKSVYNGHFCHS